MRKIQCIGKKYFMDKNDGSKKNNTTENGHQKSAFSISLKSLKGVKTDHFSDGHEHLFTTRELHLSSGSKEDDLKEIPVDDKEKDSVQENSHRNDDIKYNPDLDTDINYNRTISDHDPDSIYVSRGGKAPADVPATGKSQNSRPSDSRDYPDRNRSNYSENVHCPAPKYTEDDLHMYSPVSYIRHDISPYSSYNRVQSKQKHKKKKLKGLIITLSIVAAIVIAAIIGMSYVKSEINSLKSQAYTLKDSLKVTLEAVKDLDPDAVEASLDDVNRASDEILNTLDQPFWQTASKFDSVKDDINTVKDLVNTLNEAESEIFRPFISQMREHPMSELKVDGGFNTNVILNYLDFFDQISVELEDISEKIRNIEFKTIKVSAFDEYADKFTQLFSTFDVVKEYTPLLRALIGSGEDKLYLVMAQNSAEIRASGGFPGSMGTIRIQNGVLSIGEFSSVLDFIYSPILEASGITTREYELFGYMYGTWAHDACYNMHFSRVAEITRVAYEYRNSESLDGIISLTPVVIQRLLKISGQSITLADGTVLDGDNATRILQRDMYYTYQSDDATAEGNNEYIDPLFNETAKKTMSILTEDFDYKNLADYIAFFKEGFEDRTIMLWFADSEEEQVAIDTGCSGNLNSNQEKPVTGIYFSLSDPGKLGMFISIDMEIINTQKLEDGSIEYTVEAHYTNTITDEYMNAGTWLLGNYGGAIQCSIYLTAPMGGTIYGLEDNSGVTFTLSDYQGVQLYYAQYIYIYPGYPVTTRFKVTTAPGVETPLTLEKTPTLQEYLN